MASGLNSKRPNRLDNDSNSAQTHVKCVRHWFICSLSIFLWHISFDAFSLHGGKISWPLHSSLACVSQRTLNLSANSCWWRHYNMRSLATTIPKNPAAWHHEGICFFNWFVYFFGNCIKKLCLKSSFRRCAPSAEAIGDGNWSQCGCKTVIMTHAFLPTCCLLIAGVTQWRHVQYN